MLTTTIKYRDGHGIFHEESRYAETRNEANENVLEALKYVIRNGFELVSLSNTLKERNHHD